MNGKQYITVVLELPDDQAEVRKIVQMFPFAGDFNGAKVTALMAGDAITNLEELEEQT